MSVLFEMNNRISVRNQNKIRKMCAPLQDHFAINHFYYYSVTRDGYYSHVHSNVAWSEYFSDSAMHLDCPLVYPECSQELFLFGDLQEDKFFDVVRAGQDKFKMSLILNVMSETPEGIEAFGFGSYLPSQLAHPILLNNLPLLRFFAKRFKEENEKVFSQMNEDKVNIAKILGPKFYDKKLLRVPRTHNLDTFETFKKSLGITIYKPLTENEKVILREILNGYSAGQIATHLYRSKRTIEHTIESIKGKLNVDSKALLVQKGKELQALGFF